MPCVTRTSLMCVGRSVLIGVVVTSALLGCGGDDGDGDAAEPESPPTSEPDAGEDVDPTSEPDADEDVATGGDVVEVAPLPAAADGSVYDEDEIRSRAPVLDVGQSASFSGELLATVEDLAVTGSDAVAEVAMVNESALALSTPFVAVTCADGRAEPLVEPAGEIEAGGVIDAGAGVTGTVELAIPADCAEARLRITAQTGSAFEPSVADWSLA
jgi:hypothetical protein